MTRDDTRDYEPENGEDGIRTIDDHERWKIWEAGRRAGKRDSDIWHEMRTNTARIDRVEKDIHEGKRFLIGTFLTVLGQLGVSILGLATWYVTKGP